MELKCRQCFKDVKEKDPTSFRYIEYNVKQIEMGRNAEMATIDLDKGIFCSDQCLVDYLEFLEDSITEKPLK